MRRNVAQHMHQIALATTVDRLDEIAADALHDEHLTNEEYCLIYDSALKKAERWQAHNREEN